MFRELSRRQRFRRWCIQRLRSIAFIYIVFLFALFALQRWMLFPRYVLHHPDPAIPAQVPGLERWTLQTDDGPGGAWFLPGRGVDATHPGPAVIFAHGNGELIEDWAFAMQRYRDLGISVLLPEYRGYGDAHGSRSQAALTSDFIRYFDRLAARPDVQRGRIIIHGRSVGGGVACALAAQRRPSALILQSTFTSVAAMARKYLAPAFLVRDRFDNAAVVASLDVPMLLVHGRRDRVIPYANLGKLAAVARRATVVSYDADHNDCPPDWDEFMETTEIFLRKSGVLASLPAGR